MNEAPGVEGSAGGLSWWTILASDAAPAGSAGLSGAALLDHPLASRASSPARSVAQTHGGSRRGAVDDGRATHSSVTSHQPMNHAGLRSRALSSTGGALSGIAWLRLVTIRQYGGAAASTIALGRSFSA